MSYPGVDPIDAHETNPVGTQEASIGAVRAQVEENEFVSVPISPATPEVQQAAEKAHENAMRGHAPPVTEDLNKVVQQAVTDMFAVTDAWKPRVRVKFKIDCPSGQTALVKHLDTLDLLEHDLIEELDFFTRKLFPASIDPSGNPVEAQSLAEDSIWAALRDVEKRCRFLDMTGKLMAAASVTPKIVHDGVAVVEVTDKETGQVSKTTRFGYEMTPTEQVDSFKKPIPNLVGTHAAYSGCIDFADRMAFFQELNKPLELITPFREEQTSVLQDLARGEGHGGEAQ